MPPFIVSQSTNWWELSVLADNIAEDEKQNNPPDEIQKGLEFRHTNLGDGPNGIAFAKKHEFHM